MEKACEFTREAKAETILLLDVMTALEWHAVTPVRSILEFWQKQKDYVRNLVQCVEQIIPAVSDQNFLSRINYRTLSVIVKEWDMGGENWSTQIRDVSRL